ncbi:MAG: hypothetical protein IPI46_14060 [Bacteroidetes bacterium]|nr:hypothetical protein [Bacteroidota bacterium]
MLLQSIQYLKNNLEITGILILFFLVSIYAAYKNYRFDSLKMYTICKVISVESGGEGGMNVKVRVYYKSGYDLVIDKTGVTPGDFYYCSFVPEQPVSELFILPNLKVANGVRDCILNDTSFKGWDTLPTGASL